MTLWIQPGPCQHPLSTSLSLLVDLFSLLPSSTHSHSTSILFVGCCRYMSCILHSNRHSTHRCLSVMPVAPKTGIRHVQFAVVHLAQHFKSQKHPRDKTQTQNVAKIPKQAFKYHHIMQWLEQLQTRPIDIPMNTNNTFDTDSTDFTANLNSRDEDYIPSNAKPDTVQDAPESMAQEEHNAHSNSILQTSGLHQYILPDAPTECLYANWKELIPTLVLPYLHYTLKTLRKLLSPSPQSILLCKSRSCLHKLTKILELLFDHKFTSLHDS